MSACFYIVVEGEDPGFDTFVEGHALARREPELEFLAQSLGVPPLLNYFSADLNSMAALLEQGAGDPEWQASLPAPQWFSPIEGLATVSTLLDAMTQQPASFGADTGTLVHELSGYQRVLQKTAERGLQWHLAVSWQ